MKKILCILLCLVMLVSVAACGEDDVTPPVDTSTNNNNNNGNNNNNNDNNDANNKPADDFEAWDTEGYHIYVSSTSGVNSNDGLTAEKSVRNIERALEIASEYVGNEEDLPIIISLDEGTYSSDEKIDVISGTANTPIIFTSRNGKAVISGGTKITSDKIKPCTDTWVLDHIQTDEVKENLYEVDLSSYHFALTSVLNNLNKAFVEYDVVEFYRGDETLDLARWPNKGEIAPAMEKYGIGDKTGFELTRYINHTDKDGNFVTSDEAANRGIYSTAPANAFLCDETYEAVKNWDFDNEDVHIQNFFSYNWSDSIHKITFTDVSENPEYFNNMQFKAYITTDRGTPYRTYPLGDGTVDPAVGNDYWRRFAFINALEAIDLDGEYYYDYENEKIYVYFEDESSLDEFFIATNQEGVISCEGVEHVSFRNIDIKYSQKSLVSINNSNNISFIGCNISNAAVNAVYAYDSKNLTIKDCIICDIGCGAIYINQCCVPDDKALVDAKILIENCDIGFFGNRDICYTGAVYNYSSTGVTVRKSTIHDNLHLALYWERSVLLTWEYNEIYNFCTGTDDCGVFYNYETAETNLGLVARYNYIHDLFSDWNWCGGGVFYDDNYSTSYSIYGNVITDIYQSEKCGHVGVFSKMKINEIYGNIVVNVSDGTKFGWNVGGSASSGSHLSAAIMWRDMYSTDSTAEFTQFSNNVYKYGLHSGAWDDSPLATDETRNYTYKMWKHMRSEEFFYEMYGTAITNMAGLTIYADEDAYVQINEDNVEEFAVIVKSGTEKGTHTFTKIADLFNFLYEKCGYNAKNRQLPVDVELHYYGGVESDDLVVHELYAPLFHYNEASDKWEFSPAAEHNGITSMDKFWPKLKTFGSHVADMASWQFWAENTMNPSVYHSNLTLNMKYDLTYDPEKYTNNLTQKYNNYDVDIEGLDAIVDGEYTVDFIDLFYQIKDMGYLQDCELLDLSTVGCNLK